MIIKRLIVFSFFFGMAGVNIAAGQHFYLEQGSRAYQERDFGTAIQYLEQALATDSLRLRNYVLLGSSYLAERQPIMAERTAVKGLRHFEENPSLRWIKAEALLQQNLLERALDIYASLQERGNAPSASLLFEDKQLRQRIGLVHQALGATAYRQDRLGRAEFHFKKTREFLPDSVGSHKNLATVYLKQEAWDRAGKVVGEALAKFPGETDLMRMQANIMLETEDFEGIREQSEKLYENNPGDTEIALRHARLLLAGGDTRKAYEIYDRLLKEEPENRDIYNSLLQVYDGRRNWQAKRGVLRKMKMQFPGDASLQRKIAGTYEKQERWSRALQAYDSVKTGSKELDLAVANVYERQDSLERALERYERSLKTFVRDTTLLRKKAGLEQRMGNLAHARETYETLIEITGNGRDHTALAKVLEEMNLAGEALRHYRAAIESGTENPEPFFRAARILYRKGERDEALVRSRAALEFALQGIKEEERQMKEMLRGGTNLMELEGDDRASDRVKVLDRLAEDAFSFLTEHFGRQQLKPVFAGLRDRYSESARLLYLVGSYYQKTGDDGPALSLLQKSARLNPDLAEVHLSLGEYHISRNEEVKAIQSYERALSADPNADEPYERLIQLYRDRDELDLLCDRWRSRYRARPDNKILRTHLIEALHKAGRLDEARKVAGNG